jgi:O-antigen/teichoic acid export membrane protein/glycosyltransferase involved in cell wall biosynthesis
LPPPVLRFSFIVPFHSGLASLTRCLRALTPLTANRELLIAADGAVEDCGPLAEACGARVIAIDGPSGPATARNAAARAATGDVLVFFDSDVVVSPDSLARLERIFYEQPETAAVFGAYDDSPTDPRFVSQYKNLSHAFVHRSSSTTAHTFWTGFGAVRRDAFFDVDGFDERFRRPSVEDIDFGYRLTNAGHRIVLDAKLSACHLKHWGLKTAIVSDLRDRGIPWTQLILRYGALHNDLNVRTENRWCIVLAYLAVGLLAFSAYLPNAFLCAGLTVAMLTALNGPHYQFFYEKRGVSFAARAWLMQLLHHLCNGFSFAAGSGLFVIARWFGLRLPGSLPVDAWDATATAAAARAPEAVDALVAEPAGYGALAARAVDAAPWRLASVAVINVSKFVVGVLLAHLLTPADFGLTALALIVLGLTQPIGDLGIANAIVQRARLTDRHIRTGVTFSILVGCAVAGITIAVAPWIASLLRNPAMTPVLQLLALGFAVRGAAVIAGALLRRDLDFRRQFAIDGLSHVVGYGLVSTVLAFLGFGVWSLVWGTLLQTVLGSLAQVLSVRHAWRPLLARRELGELLRFGLGSAFSGSANYIALNGDNFVVGRWIGAASLGLYDLAYALMNLPYACVASVLSGVLLPAFARVQGDTDALRKGYLLVTQLTAMVAAPAMVTMAVAAPYLVPALYGSQWSGVVLPLQILCAVGYFRALYHIGGIVAQSTGRVFGEMWRQVVYAALVVVGALIGMSYGLAGVAVGVGAAIVYMFVATGHLALRATETTWSEYGRIQSSALVTAAITLGITLVSRHALVSLHLSNAVIAVGILASAMPSWTIGILWKLSDPECAAVRSRLPAWVVRFIPEDAPVPVDIISALHRSVR